MSHTRSQLVARAAFAAVAARADRPGADRYKAFAQQFPTLIHTCGLAQATAFALAKGKPKNPGDKPGETLSVLNDLAAVLKQARGYAEATDGGRFHEAVIAAPVGEYLRATRNALLAASWLKRYAEALLPAPAQTPPGTPA